MAGFFLCALPEYVNDKDGLLLGDLGARAGFVKRAGSLFDLYDNSGVLQDSGVSPGSVGGTVGGNPTRYPQAER